MISHKIRYNIDGQHPEYELLAKGIDFNWAIRRVADVLNVAIDQVIAFGKSPETVQVRSLLCFWAHRKLGMTTIEIGKWHTISQSAVSRSS